MNPSVFYDADLFETLFPEIQTLISPYSQVVVLSDTHTAEVVFPLLKPVLPSSCLHLTIPSGESSKTLETVERLWKRLIQSSIERNALWVNLGGGVVSDIGGFVAATYKRGIDVINIPTSLLAMVDAAIGGKNGIDFETQKNQIGTIRCPKAIFTGLSVLKSLPFRELRAGYAEMLKHALLHSEEEWEQLQEVNPTEYRSFSIEMIQRSRNIKRYFAEADIEDRGQRQMLNFGHTVGHALESYFAGTKEPLLHGEAVALGLVVEVFISHLLQDLSFETMMEIVRFIASKFQLVELPSADVLKPFLNADKKKQNGIQKMVLLNDIGNPIIADVEEKTIEEALRFYKQLMDNKC